MDLFVSIRQQENLLGVTMFTLESAFWGEWK